jgi:hypothetical protein
MSFEALVADARAAMETHSKNDDENVSLTQRVAWDIMLYRDLQIANKIKPATWAKLNEGGKALTGWRKDMKKTFVGDAPTMGKESSQAKLNLMTKYRAKAAVFDNAVNFCLAAGMLGVTSKDYIESAKLFAVPGKLLVPTDKAWKPDLGLAEAIKAGRHVPLNNMEYEVRFAHPTDSDQNAYRKIRASLRQIIAVFKMKAQTPQAAAAIEAANLKGANDTANGSFDAAVVKAVMAKRTLPELVLAIRKALNDDKSQPITFADFTVDERNTLTNFAQRVTAMAHTFEELEAAKRAATKAA